MMTEEIQKHLAFIFVMDKIKLFSNDCLKDFLTFLVHLNVRAVLLFILYLVRSHYFYFPQSCVLIQKLILYNLYLIPLAVLRE